MAKLPIIALIRKFQRRGIRRTALLLLEAVKRSRNLHPIVMGFSAGLAIAVVPTSTPGLIAALGLATLFRWNVAATLAGSMLVNPFSHLFFLLLDFRVGTWISGRPFAPSLANGSVSQFIFKNLGDLYVGGIVAGAVVFVLSYCGIYSAVWWWRRGRKLKTAFP